IRLEVRVASERHGRNRVEHECIDSWPIRDGVDQKGARREVADEFNPGESVIKETELSTKVEARAVGEAAEVGSDETGRDPAGRSGCLRVSGRGKRGKRGQESAVQQSSGHTSLETARGIPRASFLIACQRHIPAGAGIAILISV